MRESGCKRNVFHLLSDPRFELIRHDVTLPLRVEVDEIDNLACPASPVHYQHEPVHTTRTAVLGTLNMVDLARQLNAKVLQVSTSEVYGGLAVRSTTFATCKGTNMRRRNAVCMRK